MRDVDYFCYDTKALERIFKLMCLLPELLFEIGIGALLNILCKTGSRGRLIVLKSSSLCTELCLMLLRLFGKFHAWCRRSRLISRRRLEDPSFRPAVTFCIVITCIDSDIISSRRNSSRSCRCGFFLVIRRHVDIRLSYRTLRSGIIVA